MVSAIEFITSHINDVYLMRQFLFCTEIVSLSVKVTLLTIFIRKLISSYHIKKSWYYLCIALFCSALEDFAWLASLFHVFFPETAYAPVLFIIRITWASGVIMYQSFALFAESFIHTDNSISRHQKCFMTIGSGFIVYLMGLAIFRIYHPLYRPPLEFFVYNMESVYNLCILTPFTLIYTWKSLRKATDKKIIKKQLNGTFIYFMVPHLVINLYQTFPISLQVLPTGSSLFAGALSTLFLTFALFYWVRKVTQWRFLNMHNHVHNPEQFKSVNHFKSVLEELGSATTFQEVQMLTQRFFHETFQIAAGSVTLTIRTTEAPFETAGSNTLYPEQINHHTELFLSGATSESSDHILTTLKKTKILIYDEIEYDYFYSNKPTKKIVLNFLQDIHADIFLPIYEQHDIIGYICVERHARGSQLYSDLERDEMIIFASFLSKIINLLQNRNLNELLKQRKTVMEELYSKHQQINQYKETVRSFLHNSQQGIGIIFHKQGKFICANQDAHELVEIDINQHEGHPVAKTIKKIFQDTMLYQTPQSQSVKTSSGKQIIIGGIPQIEHHNVIITVYLPALYDTIKQQVDAMHDPSDWDYLLYLETTKSGKLINQLIPGNGELLLNFKIDLLKLSLSKKAILLDLPEDDIVPMAELLHHTSLRETLYIFELSSQVSHAESTIRLFGINPLYGSNTQTPLLEKLNKVGTLVIKNVHLLDLESQNNLAQFIRYGFYTVFKSNKRIQSDVRIMCTSNKDLAQLVQEGKFSQLLLQELKRESLILPPLLSLPDEELATLIQGFSDQAMKTDEFKNLIALSDKEKDYIATQRPVSLQELKKRVQQLLINKSKKTGVYQEVQFDAGYNSTDPRLIEAARLGKYALKDPKLLQALWNKFKSQNKIAMFLGVNRSSVSRRCKEHNIIE